jgi:hypothetical protein
MHKGTNTTLACSRLAGQWPAASFIHRPMTYVSHKISRMPFFDHHTFLVYKTVFSVLGRDIWMIGGEIHIHTTHSRPDEGNTPLQCCRQSSQLMN